MNNVKIAQIITRKQYKKPALKKMGSVRKLTMKVGSKADAMTMNTDFS